MSQSECQLSQHKQSNKIEFYTTDTDIDITFVKLRDTDGEACDQRTVTLVVARRLHNNLNFLWPVFFFEGIDIIARDIIKWVECSRLL